MNSSIEVFYLTDSFASRYNLTFRLLVNAKEELIDFKISFITDVVKTSVSRSNFPE